MSENKGGRPPKVEGGMARGNISMPKDHWKALRSLPGDMSATIRAALRPVLLKVNPRLSDPDGETR